MQVPNHIAIIMDGNGRWAKNKNMPRIYGHQIGTEVVREIIKTSIEFKIKTLTLFAFSSENNQRPKNEVALLFKLFLQVLKQEITKLNTNGVKIKFIGDLSIFPQEIQILAKKSEQDLSKNNNLTLIIAANYGGRWDIINACKTINNEITEQNFYQYLSIKQDIDLLIRTGGEKRISNFLLWQCAYSEFYFTDVMWPDFNSKEFKKAIIEFNRRQRRFGKI